MADNDTDFDDILEGTVDEVKDAIDELDDVDLDELLDAEKNGKDRKTVKEHIRSMMDDDDEEEVDEEIIEEADESEEEVVEEIEEETEGGLLGSFSRSSVMAGGLVVGIILGFAAATFSGTAAGAASPAQVKEDVKTIAGAGGFNGTMEITDPVKRHNMYFLNVTMTQETGNRTVSQTQGVYVTLDGEKMFLVRKQLGRTLSPIDIPSTLQQIQARQNQQTGQTGNATQ
ncbi:MAG: hypothetical protein ABEK10_04860 [Candidatus Nanosalina sp.]